RPLCVEIARLSLFVALVGATIRRTPQAGVTGRVVDNLQLGIIAVPTPSSTAADLVVLAREALSPQVPTSLPELRVGFVGVGRQAHVLVRTRAVADPNLRAVPQVEGSDTAA